jgi:GTP pyrophosphokinase
MIKERPDFSRDERIFVVSDVSTTSSLRLSYLPADFSPSECEQVEHLAALAMQAIKTDTDTTVTPETMHEVAQTLIAAACDARTLMIFFMSLLNEDMLADLRSTYPEDLLAAAHTVSIIRLLSERDAPNQLPIRKVLLRQLVLKVTHDVRVILVKIAGRLVTLRNAHNWPPERLKPLAQEALDVVVPWCDALALENWRQELQELSFKYLQPEKYNYILSLMADHRDLLHEVKDQVTREIRALLEKHQVKAHVTGRVKTHYAVYRKMEVYELQYDEVWDRIGIRILTHSVNDCYYIQAAIEEELYPERRRYVDYIEKPRPPYNYQSLHLTVSGPKQIAVEIQIRTFDMHIKGEYGVAAHWKMYGGGEGVGTNEDVKFAFLRTQASRLLGDPMEYLGNTLDTLLYNNSILPMDTSGYVLDPETGERVRDSAGEELFYRNVTTNEQGYILDPHTQTLLLSKAGEPIWFQSEILPNRVLVYTPLGDIKSLPVGATSLDFAYYVHERVGNTCVGAKVNGKIQKLDYVLQLGDRVEIITRKNAKPSPDWLYNGYVKTRRAQDKIRRYFREKEGAEIPELEQVGQAILRKRLSAHKIRDLATEQICAALKFKTERDLYEALGSGELSTTALDDYLGQYLLEQLSKASRSSHVLPRVSNREFELLYVQAQCCLPLPGDETYSYISQGQGFVLHRAQCRNLSTLDPARVSYFDWPEYTLCDGGQKPPASFSCRLLLVVVNPSKTLLHIKDVANIENLIIESVQLSKEQQLGTQLMLTIRTACREQADRLIRKLNASDDILMIRRHLG